MTTRRARIAVLAPLDRCLGLLSELVPALVHEADVVVFSPQAAALRDRWEPTGASFEWMEARPLWRLPRELATALLYAEFYRRQSRIDRDNLRDDPRWSWKGRLLMAVVNSVARYVFKPLSPRWDDLAKRAMLGLMPESRRIERVLRDRRIDLVFSTIPLFGHYEWPALWAARRLGIPTACLITSWDNLFNKGRLPLGVSHYLVWGDPMRADFRRYYPEILPRAITAVGALQFDVYRRPELLAPRAQFVRSIGGDPARKLILWSASWNVMLNESAVVARFCEAARAGRLHGNPQILVRPHPYSGTATFVGFREQYPEVLFAEASGLETSCFPGWGPGPEASALIVNSIAHCDVNVSHCSTMTLDCCAFDRPVVNVAFDAEPGSDRERYVRDCYEYEHYRPVVECGAVRMAHDADELVTHVNAYLDDPSLDRDRRAALLRLECGDVDGKAATRAVDCLLRLVEGRRPAADWTVSAGRRWTRSPRNANSR